MSALRLLARRFNYSTLRPARVLLHPNVATTPSFYTLQDKRHSSNEAPSYFFLFSPDLPPVYALQVFLETVHTWTHLPWWAVIVGSTVALRSIVTVPLAIYQNKLLAEIEMRQPTISMMTEALKHRVVGECRRSNQPPEEAERQYLRKSRKMISEYYKSEGLSPLRLSILPWTQLPLWFFLSLSLRNLAGFFPWQRNAGEVILPCPDITHEGALWFPDLTAADPTLIIPCAVGIFNLANIELHALRQHNTTRFQRILTNTLRLVSVGMIFVAAQVPSAMCLYWAVSAFFGLAQNITFKFPAVRRLLGIPKTPNESQHPVQDLKNLLQLKGEEFVKIQREGRSVKKKE